MYCKRTFISYFYYFEHLKFHSNFATTYYVLILLKLSLLGDPDMIDVSGVAAASFRDATKKQVTLTPDERLYLMAVERGDCPTVQRCLERAKV